MKNEYGQEIVSINEAYDSYNEMLDSYGEVKIGSLVFQPHEIVQELDPTAYRVGFADYCDAQDWDVVGKHEYDELIGYKD